MSDCPTDSTLARSSILSLGIECWPQDYFSKRNLADRISSVVLVSPKNEILLLHRVQTSSSFASAHVFPGGNLSSQDGHCPPPGDHARHDDAPAYRFAAIRELFEESGILLAKDRNSGKMLAVNEETREEGRRLIHQNQITFAEWLKQQRATAEPDIGWYLSLVELSRG